MMIVSSSGAAGRRARPPSHGLEPTPRRMLVAGSRHGRVSRSVCAELIHHCSIHGYSVSTGCAPGVDGCFRAALAAGPHAWDCLVACAFPSRVRAARAQGLRASLVVSPGLSPRAALARRSIWLVEHARMVLLFPMDPTTGRWGRGSSLVFRTAVERGTPVFVVCARAPHAHTARVAPATLFDVVEGWWVAPASGACAPGLDNTLFCNGGAA